MKNSVPKKYGLGIGMKNSVANTSRERIDERVLGKSWEREFPLMPGGGMS